MISAVVGGYYYTFTDDHLHTFVLIRNEESLYKVIMNDDTFVYNIFPALTTNLLTP